MTISIAFATFLAVILGFLSGLHPRLWVSFYRAELVNGGSRRDTQVGFLLGGTGQSLTSAVLGLLIATLTLSIVAAADSSTQMWTGVAVIVYSLVFVHRAVRPDEDDWPLAADLLTTVSSAEEMPPAARRAARSKFGPFEHTLAQVARQTAFSPTFVLSPLFVAAAGSGLPNVWNSVPVIAAYAVSVLLGQIWFARGADAGSVGKLAAFSAERFDVISAAGTILLGLVTALT